jgi:hypothetical protein
MKACTWLGLTGKGCETAKVTAGAKSVHAASARRRVWSVWSRRAGWATQLVLQTAARGGCIGVLAFELSFEAVLWPLFAALPI